MQLAQHTCFANSRAKFNDGSNMETNKEIIAITINSSISVKARMVRMVFTSHH
jgi:ammonia channel protein AmtB